MLNLAENKKLTMIDVGGHMATSSINRNSSNGTQFNSSGTIFSNVTHTTNYGKFNYMRINNMIFQCNF